MLDKSDEQGMVGQFGRFVRFLVLVGCGLECDIDLCCK